MQPFTYQTDIVIVHSRVFVKQYKQAVLTAPSAFLTTCRCRYWI